MSLTIACRSLRHSPGFALAAALTLGLGLGFHTLLFNAVHALLVRPLPFPESERLVVLRHTGPEGRPYVSATGADHARLAELRGVFTGLGVVRGGMGTEALRDGDRLVELKASGMDSGYLKVLGVRPLLGRTFGAEEDRGEGAEVPLLLTAKAWRERFGSDPGLLGRPLRLERQGTSQGVRVVGILPEDTTLPLSGGGELFFPLEVATQDFRADTGDAFYRIVGRLAPGRGPADASAAVAAAFRAESLPAAFRDQCFHVDRLRSVLMPSQRLPLFLLAGAASLLPLLTCVNVASLFLARVLERDRETALRAALGATPSQAFRQHGLEALLVGAAGLALAFFLRHLALPVLLLYLPDLQRVGPELLKTSPALLAFSLSSAFVCAAAVGVLPVLGATRPDLARSLASGGRGGTGRLHPWRRALVGVQVALVLVLLTTSSLLGRSFHRALTADPGFRPEGLASLVVLPPVPLEGMDAAAGEMKALAEAIPGVRRVGYASGILVGGTGFQCNFHAGGGSFAPGDPDLFFHLISMDILDVLGARVLEGRGFQASDARASVAVLNEAAARRLFPGASAVGRVVRSGVWGRTWTVIGVVKDMRLEALDQAAQPAAFLPFQPIGAPLHLVVESGLSPALLEGRLRTLVAGKGVRVRAARALAADLAATLAERERALMLMGAFSVLGLLVGCVGIYGTLAGQVAGRRRELGIRGALGAERLGLVRLVLLQGVRLVIPGVVAGAALSLAVARLAQASLFGIGAFDPPAFLLSLVLLAAAALLACLLPALRAARVAPAEALRSE
jgi:predicted permease